MKPDMSDVLMAAGLICIFAAVYLLGGWIWLLLLVGILLFLVGVLYARRVKRS